MSRLQIVYIFLSAITVQPFSSATENERELKTCKLLLSASSELIVTLSPPSSSLSLLSRAAEWVSVNKTVYLICRNASMILSGSSQLTCQQDGSWNHDMPTCSLNITQSQAVAVCPIPPSHFANGRMTTSSNSRTIIYQCNDGYRLLGTKQRQCLPNSTWSTPIPRCVVNGHGYAWTAAFRDNSKWQGLYDYDGQSVQFTLAVHLATDDVVKAALQDHITQLELTGRRQNGYIVFNATRIDHGSTTTTLTDWSVAGRLTTVGGHWVYSGIVTSTQSGFLKLMMSPTTPTPAANPKESSSSEQLSAASVDYDYGEMPSSTALGLGVTIAVVAIVIAGGLAAFCAHRGAGLCFSSHSAHQTLTSFENPIYDAGQIHGHVSQ